MVDPAIALPNLVEIALLIAATMLYLLPGFLLGLLLYGYADIKKGVIVGSSLMATVYVLFGFFLSALQLLTASWFLALWFIATALLAICAYLRLGLPTLSLDKNQLNRLLFLLLSFAFAFGLYYVWEGKAPGVGAWDRSEHVVNLLYAVYHARLPITEIGMQVYAFYPQGFNVNAFLFAAFGRMVNPAVDYQVMLIGYFAFCLAFLVVPAYAIGRNVSEHPVSGVVAVLAYLPGSYLLIFESMPSSLAMLLVGAIIMLATERKTSFKTHTAIVVTLAGVFLIHMVIFLYVLVILFVLMFAQSSSMSDLVKRILVRGASVTLGSFAALIILFTMNTPLFYGTLSTVLGGSSTEGTSISDVELPALATFLPIKWQGIAFYFAVISPLIPVFLFGVILMIKSRDKQGLALLAGSMYLSMAGIARFNNRIRFFMLYPTVMLATVGILGLVRLMRTALDGGLKSSLRHDAIVRGAVTAMLLLLFLAPVSNAALGYGNATSNWNVTHRAYGNVDEKALNLTSWMHKNGFDNIGNIATPNDATYYQIVEAMTHNKVIMASTWNRPRSFADITRFFSSSTNESEIREIAEMYNLVAYLVRGQQQYPHLYDVFIDAEIVQATPAYLLVLLNRS